MKERSAGVIIANGEEYLLLHYNAGHWDFPKGHLEAEESFEQTALRELQEETGIDGISLLPGFSEKIEYVVERDGVSVPKEVVFFLARVDSTNVTLSHEHQHFEWLSFEDAIEKLTFDNAKEVLKKARAFLESYEES